MQSRNVKFLLMLATGLVVMGLSTLAFAQPAAAAEAAVDVARAGATGWIALAAGLAIGLAAIGGTLGQGRAAASMLDGIARNPGAADKMFTPFILGLALMESLVIFALLIAFLLQGNL
jgi:F-type H+-transporting ATPase subunit c